VHYLSVRINKVGLFLSYGQIIPAAALLPASISPETLIYHSCITPAERARAKRLSLWYLVPIIIILFRFICTSLALLGWRIGCKINTLSARREVSAYTQQQQQLRRQKMDIHFFHVWCRACNHNRPRARISRCANLSFLYVLGENINHSPRVRGSR
jgi:hypothetical protein